MRLIDAKALIENRDLHIVIGAGDNICIDIADIAKAPTVDAVEVVRCKDCVHGIWDDEEAMWKCVYSAEFDEGISEWFGFYEYNDGNHFCSYGERKDE